MARVGILGAGSWGIALSTVLHKNGHDVTVWSILEDEVQLLRKNREHKEKLPGVMIPEEIVFTSDLKETVPGRDV
ncbi:MAG: glycerol-3-phosphate dehydrogenase, partial [Lachnospiraceae bacterium]|nr:glycerol-3-phosphate dehydrogenase [Lachnospiraceae bacterium]